MITQLSTCTKSISTHSLTKRLTVNISILKLFMTYFNSQPHEEADMAVTVNFKTASISTHSLTKRLTMRTDQIMVDLIYFNSQPHEEADKIWSNKYQTNWNFNSQPHEEAD